MNENDAMPLINRLQVVGMGAAVLGVIGALVLLLSQGAAQFYQTYLMAYLFWFGLGLGCLALLMIQHLSGGRWGFISRRILEAGAMTLPILFVLFVPIFFGMSDLYKWTDPQVVADDHLLQHKEVYLNSGGYVLRTVIYFVIWSLLAFLFFVWSRAQDTAPDGDFGPAKRMRYLSGLGILLYVITMTTASVDWAMSIEPHFFSTMYGVLFMVGQGLTGFAFLVLMVALVGKAKPFSDVIDQNRIHDLGKLMFAFVILWAYVSFGQYVIIWSGNLPEFTPWYINRTELGWITISLVLIIFHFGVPFFVLLSRPIKRTIKILWIVAILVIVMRMVDIFWLIAPDYYTDGFNPATLLPYAIVLVALGGIWVTAFTWLLKQRPLIPQNDLRNDPRMRKGHAHA